MTTKKATTTTTAAHEKVKCSPRKYHTKNGGQERAENQHSGKCQFTDKKKQKKP